MNPDLELVSKLLLDPDCHSRLRSVHGQKHVILEVDSLREYREPLVEIIRESWRTSSSRNKLKLFCVEGKTRLHEIFAGELEPPSIEAASHDVKKHLCLKNCIIPLVDFRDLFPSQLSVFRVQSDHYGGISDTSMEIHPNRSRCGNKERMNDGA